MGAIKTILFAIAIIATILSAVPHVHAEQYQNGLAVNGCALDSPDGLIPDRDCDGLDDYHDNCKYVPNADQRDSNRNGLGDKCDLLITSINLDPGTEVKQGTFFTVRVQLINNKAYELENIQARIRNSALDIDISSYVESMKPGEVRTIDFLMKAPGCATPGKYELTFTTDHKEGEETFTQTTFQRIVVTENEGACTTGSDGALDNTIIETITQQEVEPGDKAVYPITIINMNGEAKTYHLSVADINHIGTYRIDPDPSFTIPAGKSHTAYLYLQTESFAPIGRNTITIYLESEGKEDSVDVGLRVIKSESAPLKKVLGTIIQLALILIVLALIIGAGIVAYKKVNEDHDEPAPPTRRETRAPMKEDLDDEDFESYY